MALLDEDQQRAYYNKLDEVKYLKDTLKRLVDDLNDQTQENIAERGQLKDMFDKYEGLMQEFLQKKGDNDMMKA